MKIYEPNPPPEAAVPEPPAPARHKPQFSMEFLAKQKAKAELRALTPKFARTQLAQIRPIHREMIKRLIEGQKSAQVAKDLGLTARYVTYLKNHEPLFMVEMERAIAERELKVASRMQNLSGESLDVLKQLMRDSKSDQVRLEAAKTVLDRAGYSKLEKRVTLTADAESVIRELNRKNPRANPDDIEVTAE